MSIKDILVIVDTIIKYVLFLIKENENLKEENKKLKQERDKDGRGKGDI